MHNLLDFYSSIVEGKESVYDIDKSRLNSNKTVYEVTDLKQSFPKKDFNKAMLRKFISDNSEEMFKLGNLIKGNIKGNKVNLIVLKRL